MGIKEASGNLDQVSEILAGRPQGFELFSGDDSLTLPMLGLGARGVISVVGNVTPKRFGGMVHDALAGRFSQAAAAHLSLNRFYKLLFEEGNPVGVKCAAAQLGLCENRLRLPLVPASSDLERRIAEGLAQLKEL